MLSRRTFQKGLLGTLATATMPREGISQPAAHAITAVDSHAQSANTCSTSAKVQRGESTVVGAWRN